MIIRSKSWLIYWIVIFIMEKKSKSWLSRLKYFKMRKRSSSTSRINCLNEENSHQRSLSTFDNENARHTSHFRRRNSFRQSIINIPKHVKNIFRNKSNSSTVGFPNEAPNLSHINSRVSEAYWNSKTDCHY